MSERKDDLIRERLGESERRESIFTTDDPVMFLTILRETSEYKKRIGRRLKEARKIFASNPLTQDEPKPILSEIRTAFEGKGRDEGVEEFKQLLWDFYQDCLHLNYSQDGYSDKFNQSFIDYKVRAQQSLLSAQKGEKKELQEKKDRIRSQAHDKAAEILQAELAERSLEISLYTARVLIRCFLVDTGVDYVESARQADQARILRNLGEDRKAVARQLASREFKLTEKQKSWFSPEQAAAIQDKYLKSLGLERQRPVYKKRIQFIGKR